MPKLCALFLAFVFAAAGGAAGERIGLALPTHQEERWRNDLAAISEEARKLGVDLRVQMARNDQLQQNHQIEQLLAQDIKVLIITPHDCQGAAMIVEKARQNGVKVISYDRIVTDCEYELFVGFDSVKIGELQAEWLIHAMPKGDYALLSGAPTDFNATLIRRGADAVLQPAVARGDIRIVADEAVVDWQADNAKALIAAALAAANNKIDAILAPNDNAAGAVVEELATVGLAGKTLVVGHDGDLAGLKRIVEGSQQMTVFKDVRLLGQTALRLALQLARGETIDTGGKTQYNEYTNIPAVLIDPVGADKTNLDQVVIQNGFFTAEDIYGK